MDQDLSLKGNKEIEDALKEFEIKSIDKKGQEQKNPVLKSETDDSLNLKENIGIEEALKEFESKPHLEEQEKHFTQNEEEGESLKKYTGIKESLKEFEKNYSIEEEKRRTVKIIEVSKNSRLVDFIIRISGGLIKEQKQAEYVLLGMALLFFSTSVLLFFNGINKQKPQQIPLELLEQMKKIQTAQQNNN